MFLKRVSTRLWGEVPGENPSAVKTPIPTYNSSMSDGSTHLKSKSRPKKTTPSRGVSLLFGKHFTGQLLLSFRQKNVRTKRNL